MINEQIRQIVVEIFMKNNSNFKGTLDIQPKVERHFVPVGDYVSTSISGAYDVYYSDKDTIQSKKDWEEYNKLNLLKKIMTTMPSTGFRNNKKIYTVSQEDMYLYLLNKINSK